ncbi:MAG: hypothetical protein JWQ98_2556 [Chlorobi bacterium]|nr:hypothetical protein [Chlorobiota bacterium]
MNMKRVLSALALLVAIVQPGLNKCAAQYQNTHVGVVSTCDYTGSVTLIGTIFPNGRETINLTGVVSFQTIATSGSADGVAWENLAPVGFSGSGASLTLGQIGFQLDGWRTAPLSSIVASQPNASLPATGTLSFYLTVTIAAQPGVVYESMQPVTESGLIQVWPHSGAPYNQTNNVDFQDRARPGITVFSIISGGAPVSVTARN